MNKKTQRIAVIGVISAFAIILSYIESLISFNFFVPGVKLGLANLAVVMVMYILGNREAIIVNLIRILIVGLLFTNLFSILFSIAGAVISFLLMVLAKRTGKLSVMGVSVIGGVSHNIGQIIVAAFVVETYSVIYYVPVLIVAGVVTGMINGIVSETLVKYLRGILK